MNVDRVEGVWIVLRCAVPRKERLYVEVIASLQSIGKAVIVCGRLISQQSAQVEAGVERINPFLPAAVAVGPGSVPPLFDRKIVQATACHGKVFFGSRYRRKTRQKSAAQRATVVNTGVTKGRVTETQLFRKVH